MNRIIAAILLLLLLPLELLILLSYYPGRKANPIFKQKRIGWYQVGFLFYKFRTLDPDESKSLTNRKFAFGNFLRKTSLDELPQLWNILKGEMVFVGPRPLPIEYLPYFTETQKKRFEVKPGLTGWAQVNGRTAISWNEKLGYDIYYVENKTFLLDIKIILKTLQVIFNGSNRYSLDEQSFIDFMNEKNINNSSFKLD